MLQLASTTDKEILLQKLTTIEFATKINAHDFWWVGDLN